MKIVENKRLLVEPGQVAILDLEPDLVFPPLILNQNSTNNFICQKSKMGEKILTSIFLDKKKTTKNRFQLSTYLTKLIPHDQNYGI